MKLECAQQWASAVHTVNKMHNACFVTLRIQGYTVGASYPWPPKYVV